MRWIRSKWILVALAGSLLQAQADLGRKGLGGTTQGSRLSVAGTLDDGSRVRLELQMGVDEIVTSEQGSRQSIDPIVTLDENLEICPVVTSTLVEINGQAVDIPRNAFMSMVGIQRVRIWRTKGVFYLQFHGGAGTGAFEAVFKVFRVPAKETGRLAMVERVLRIGAETQGPWERTVFRYRWDEDLEPLAWRRSP